MGNYLIIGGSGVMGTAAIKAVRKKFGNDAVITANWFGKEDQKLVIEGANHTVYGDITSDSCLDEIKKVGGEEYDYLFYATALGEVGFSIRESTPEQIKHSNRLSFEPLPVLEEKFQIKTIVAYSTFYLLRHQIYSYGAMGYSKEAIEKWILKKGKSHRTCIRAGLFFSHSSRAIKLLLRKNAKGIKKENNPLLSSYFEDVATSVGIKKFEEGIMQEERDTYGDSPTDVEALYMSHLKLLETEKPVFINVCGKKIWESNEPLILEGKI
jgi:hypothetical protein|tara:strand:- start:86 stop:889 length:804 start_codon:yes stop_codon:yes gene_type:complete